MSVFVWYDVFFIEVEQWFLLGFLQWIQLLKLCGLQLDVSSNVVILFLEIKFLFVRKKSFHLLNGLNFGFYELREAADPSLAGRVCVRLVVVLRVVALGDPVLLCDFLVVGGFDFSEVLALAPYKCC